MNLKIELSSGKIVDLNRFVALVPTTETTNARYSLTLEGCSHIIYLDRSEADIVKKHLKIQIDRQKDRDWDKEEQLKKNQPAIKLIKERIERHKLMSEEESKQRTEFFGNFQKTIDAERSIRKLYEK